MNRKERESTTINQHPLFHNDTSTADLYHRQGICYKGFMLFLQNILHNYHTICILNITCILYVDFET